MQHNKQPQYKHYNTHPQQADTSHNEFMNNSESARDMPVSMMMQSHYGRNQYVQIQNNRSQMRQSIGQTSQVPQSMEQMEKIFSYMKNIVSNPSLMGQMQKYLASKESQKNSRFIVTDQKHQSYNSDNQRKQLDQSMSYSQRAQQQKRDFFAQPYTSSNYNQNQQSIKPLKPTPKRNYNTIGNHQNRKKGKDVLTQYISGGSNQESIEQARSQQPQKMKQSKPPVASFQDMPIKSQYIQQITQQKDNIPSDRTYQPAATYPQQQILKDPYALKNPPINNSIKQPLKKQPLGKDLQRKYEEDQQRPINGTKQDFKQLLKEKFNETPFNGQDFDEKPIGNGNTKGEKNFNPFSQQNAYPPGYEYKEEQQADIQYNNQTKPKRQFLKRGSRQYLSSAKDRRDKKSSKNHGNKKQQNNNNNNNDQSYLQESQVKQINKNDRSKTPTNKRDTSQNRILSRRNTQNNSKSANKIKKAFHPQNQSNLEDSRYQQQGQIDVMRRKSITPKGANPIKQQVRGNGQRSRSPLPPKKPQHQVTKQNNTSNLNKSIISNSGASSNRKKNVFQDSSSSQDQQQNSFNTQAKQPTRGNNLMQGQSKKYQPQKQYDMFSRQKKQQFLPGVFLTQSQLTALLEKYNPGQNPKNKEQITEQYQQKFNKLRKKYTDLCSLVQKQREQQQQQFQRKKQQFQQYKANEIQKLKNQKRIIERQLKSSQPSQQNHLINKEQLENLKKQLEREKENHKKKDKNNKILIQKYKKEAEQYKIKVEILERENQGLKEEVKGRAEKVQKVEKDRRREEEQKGFDKSRSKSPIGRDVSPANRAKTMGAKSTRMPHTPSHQEEQQQKYKKTVPYNKTQSYKDCHQNQSDDENLPTFKVSNKSSAQYQEHQQQSKTNIQSKKSYNNNYSKQLPTKKKYQYVQNSSITNQQNQSNAYQRQSTKQSSSQSNKQIAQNNRNVFIDSPSGTQSQSVQDHQNDSRYYGNHTQKPKFRSLKDISQNNFSVKCITPQLISTLFRHQNNPQYQQYLQQTTNNPNRQIINSSKNGVDKKITNIYNDKSKQILFENGVKKEILPNGYTIIYFKNGDIKQKLSDGTILYYFKEKQVDQITLNNGLNIYRFDNDQVQLHYDGGKYIQIRHPDGTIKVLGAPGPMH